MSNQRLKLPADSKQSLAPGPALLLMLSLSLVTSMVYAVDLMSPFKKLFGSGNEIIVWQSQGQFVKIVEQDWDRDHRRAPANAHPHKIDPNHLAAAFASLKSDKQDDALASGESVPLFTAEEIEILIPKLADALDRTGPQQDVVFAVTGRHDDFTGNQFRSNAGRMFMHQGRLNIIFGDVLSPVRDRDSDNISHFAKPHRAGKRAKWLDRDNRIAEAAGITYWEGSKGSRPDWILVDLATAVEAYQGPRILLTIEESKPDPDNRVSDLPQRKQMQEEIVRLREELQQGKGESSAIPGAATMDGNTAPANEELLNEEAKGATTAPPAATSRAGEMATNHELIRQRLNSLKSMHQDKLITDDEYTAKRQEILKEF